MEKATIESTSTPIDYVTNYSGTGVWYWHDNDTNTWRKYSEDLQPKLESAFREIHENNSVKVVVDGKNYTIFPIAGIQVNGLTGCVRRLTASKTDKESDSVWSWQCGKSWQPYSDEVSFMINAARRKVEKARFVEFTFNGSKYLVDLFNLTQMNTATKWMREIKREEN